MGTVIYFSFFCLLISVYVAVRKLLASADTFLGYAAGLIGAVCLIYLALVLFFNSFARAADDRSHIAVVDTGANIPAGYARYICNDNSHLDLTNQGLNDVNGHGTNIAGILAKSMNPTRQCLQIIKWYHNQEHYEKMRKLYLLEYLSSRSLKHALKYKAKFVNLSYGGPEPYPEEYRELMNLLNTGAIVAIAAGNEAVNLDNACNYYPACYAIAKKNFHVVGNKGSGSTNYGNRVTDWANGNNVEGFGVVLTGTSQATAVWLSEEIKRAYRR